MKKYKKLKVWELSHQLTLNIYKLTRKFPKEETYRLVDQMRRAAYSAPSKITEGNSRETQKEFKRFLVIARASIDELAYFLLLAKDLEYISEEEFLKHEDQCSHVASMINNLIGKLKI